jgi:hypothetical protein
MSRVGAQYARKASTTNNVLFAQRAVLLPSNPPSAQSNIVKKKSIT